MNPTIALTRAAALAALRDRVTLFFSFAFPLAFLVLFGVIFRGQDVTGDRTYISYIAPGVLAWGIGNAALFGVAFTIMQWRQSDLLRLVRRSPAPASSVLAARFAVALAVGVVQAVLFVAVACVPFFGLQLSSRWPLGLPVLLLGVTAFLAIGALVGNLANSPEAVAGIANLVMVPMAFLSGAFYPADLMPGWLQQVAKALPLHWFLVGMADTVAGAPGGAGTVALCCVVLAGFAAAFTALTARTFRWSPR